MNINTCPHYLTIPTILTLVRILLTPCIVWAICDNYWAAAFVLFCFSAVTDALDGFIARRYNQQSLLGAFLDPLADKFLMMSMFVALLWHMRGFFIIPLWFVLLVVAKELLFIIVAIVLFSMRYRILIRPTILGKLAMAAQVGLVAWIFMLRFWAVASYRIHHMAIYSVALIVIITCFDYGLKVHKVFKNTKHKQRSPS